MSLRCLLVKILITACFMICILFGCGVEPGQVLAGSMSSAVSSGSAGPTIFLNQKKINFDVLPIIQDGRTLVPMRAIFESLGAQLLWDGSNQLVTATMEGTMVQLKIGSLHPIVNGQEKTIDVPAQIYQGRTLVPLRFVGEVFGGQVKWDAGTNSITINTPQPVNSDESDLTVEGDYINLRSGPGTTYDQVGTALRGSIFKALVKLGDWYKVEYQGKQVWVASQLVKPLWSTLSNRPSTGAATSNGPSTQPTTQQPPANQVSLDYRNDSDGIRLVMLCGSKPDVKVSEKGSSTTYRYPGFSLMENKSCGESTPAGVISIKTSKEGNDLVVEISLPAGFESKRSEELNGNKQVFFIPNCIVGVERQPLDRGGERLAVKTLVPATYTESRSGKTMTVKMPGVRKGVAKSAYEYSSSSLSKLAFNAVGPNDTEVVITTKEDAKFNIGLQDMQKSLYILFMKKSELPKPGTVVVLDPGHGGSESGASGQSLLEKDINLSVAQKVGDILKKKGIQVSYTHSDDTYRGLAERPGLANLLNAALFVSIHSNWFGDSSVNGTETYYYASSGEARINVEKNIAALIQNKLVAALGLPDRGIKQNEYAVLTRCEVPGVLTEIAFLSNPGQEQLLKQQNYRDKAAAAIAEAISEYMNGLKK